MTTTVSINDDSDVYWKMEPSEESIFKELKEMFPDTDQDTILSILINSNWNSSSTVETLLSGSSHPQEEADIILPEGNEANYDTMLAELIQAQYYGEVDYDEQLGDVLREGAAEARTVQAEVTKKPGFSKKFKEKLSNLFRRKKKLDEVKEENKEGDVELIEFNGSPSEVKGGSLDRSN